MDIIDAQQLPRGCHIPSNRSAIAREHNIGKRQALTGAECSFKGVVLRVDKSNAASTDHPNGTRISIGETARQTQRLIHDFVKILSATKLGTKRRNLCNPLALLLTLLAKQLVHGKQAAIRSINFRVPPDEFRLAVCQ
jgi:hypothetical protein